MLLNKKVPICFLVKKIRCEFLLTSIVAVAIGFFDQHLSHLNFPLAAPTILGTAISLLLAFRTAQAYDRWWEARIIWGQVVNSSRTLIRELKTFLDPSSKTHISNFIRRQVAWCYVLGESLRGLDSKESLEKYLNEEELRYVSKHSNPPNAILDLHSQELRQIFAEKKLNEFQQIRIDETISILCDCMGRCERIKKTVFPVTYSNVLDLLIYVFIVLLPFSLTNYSLLVEVSLTIVISTSFFLIEKTAIYKQDPFENRPTDTPMTAIARSIEITLNQMNESEAVIEPLEPVPGKFYIL